MTFGERLRDLRQQKKLSQVELAKTFNITSATLSQYELNKRFPDQDMLNKLADFFGVTMGYLMARPDEHSKLVKENMQKMQEINDKKDAEKYMQTHAPLLWNEGLTDDDTRKALWDILIENFLTARKNNREKLQKSKESKS